MKRLDVTVGLGVVLAVGLVWLAGCGGGSAGLPVGSEAPDFTLQDLSGSEVSLKIAGEKQPVAVLVFWATWCTACVDEIPALKQFYSDYSGRGVRLLSINVDKGGHGVAPFAEENGVNYPVLLDSDSSVARKYGVRGIPNVLVVDALGIVRYNGHDIHEAQKIVDSLL